MTTYKMQQFTTTPKGTLVADASSLGVPPGASPAQQLHPLSPDHGIQLEHADGEIVNYRLIDIMRTPDGEIYSWTFRAVPARHTNKVVIFND